MRSRIPPRPVRAIDPPAYRDQATVWAVRFPDLLSVHDNRSQTRRPHMIRATRGRTPAVRRRAPAAKSLSALFVSALAAC